ncbi:MAG: PLP-dependent aminotransferase family protein [Pseudomonadota bacterium]
MGASEIRELLKVIEAPGVISFAGGIPDPALFPQAAVAEAYRHVLTATGPAALQYSVSDGDPELKSWVVRHMARLGVPCEPENILITSGSQQGLEFLGRLLISPGDAALVAAPTYLGALQAFSAYEPRYDALPTAETNRTATSYGERAPAFAYVVPEFANPSGETMDAAQRRDLLALARDLGTLVIEDSPYAELRFEGEAPPALLATDIAETGHIDRSRVAYCGSFSKIFTPGLRVGWICARADLIERLVLVKQASDLNAPRINQLVILRLAETLYAEQVAKARATYRVKRDAMLAALAAHMPAGARWTRPEGGMFIWLEVDGDFDAKAMLPDAVEAGVAYVPGSAFHHDGAGRNAMRLSYSLPDPATIETGVKRLAALISENIGGGRVRA